MDRINILSEKEVNSELEEIKKEFSEQGLIYAPNSIWHGWPNNGHHDPKTILTIEKERLADFLNFLFNESEHCDHISYSNAWQEFEEFEHEQSKLKV